MFLTMPIVNGCLLACKPRRVRLLHFCAVVLLYLLLHESSVRAQTKKLHIVYLGDKVPGLLSQQAREMHLQILSKALGERHGDSVHYSYSAGFNGFAAMLSDEEVEAVSDLPEVLSVFPSTVRQLATTRSYNFLGLDRVDPAGTWQLSLFGEGVVIGLFDSGIWPEARSFSPQDMPPPPAYWKGVCQVGEQFDVSTCNNKVVGARYYYYGFQQQYDMTGNIRSARDEQGHGSHVASIAAGTLVQGANVEGLAFGNATGGAPMAHIAVYKVCWTYGGILGACDDADILAAFDDAILDGVDIVSMSITGSEQMDYFLDAVAIGGYHAMQRGIFVTVPAGNEGPDTGSVVNVPPWLTTVGANTMDRDFISTLTLGDGTKIQTPALRSPSLNNTFFPLVYASSAGYTSIPFTGGQLGSCGIPDTLDPTKVAGTIVLCTQNDYTLFNLSGPILAGAVGIVVPQDYPRPKQSPVENLICYVSLQESDVILHYIQSTGQPVATISTTTRTNISPAPVISPFSSRGPNPKETEILKPDLTAPGVNILAAWTQLRGSTPDGNPTSEFTFESGTSMATPHVAGIAALIKSLHRDWSPAAIKSALMTTATLTDKAGNGITKDPGGFATPLDFGAGMINPAAAANPGLVYDITPADYELFLCTAYPFNQTAIASLTSNPAPCSSPLRKLLDLNYPSICVPDLVLSETVVRTVTNVGPAAQVTYTAILANPAGVSMTVTPAVLSFTSIGEQLSFALDLTLEDTVNPDTQHYTFGSLQWTDGEHTVRSVVAVQPGRLALITTGP